MAIDMLPEQTAIQEEIVSPHTLTPHPYNKRIYGDESLASLKEMIVKSHRIERLLVTPANTIISGHRRWCVAKELGMNVPIERRAFSSEVEEVEALLLANVAREKTVEQRTREGKMWEYVEAEKAKRIQQAQGKHGKEGGRGHKKGETLEDTCPQGFPKENPTPRKRAPQARDKVAAQVGLGSGKNYERAEKAVETIDHLKEQGNTEEADVLRSVLEQSVNAAAQIATMPEQKQTAVLEMIATGQAKTVKGAEMELAKAERDAQSQSVLSKPYVTLASWSSWLPLQPTCDLLLTDPPYSTDVEDIDVFAHSWLPVALSKVKDTGRAYICIGAYPHELKSYLNVSVPSHLRLLNILVWAYENTIGPSPNDGYKQNWQAILYFAGINAPKLDCPIMTEQFTVQRINAPDGRQGDRYHTWQKPNELAERLIHHSTKQGDIVLDCFAGTGTFLLAAHRLGRVASGCDASEDMLKIAERRGCEVLR